MAPSGVIAHWRGRRALEPMEIFSSVQRRARSTPLRDGDSDTRRPCWTLSLRFLRAFPLFFGLPIYGLFSAVYFGYVVTGRYVMLHVATVVRSMTRNSTFKQTSTLSAVRLAFYQGHRPKERFCVLREWSLRGCMSSRVPAFILPVWLLSQEFPELSRVLPGLEDQHTKGAVPRTRVEQLSKTNIVVGDGCQQCEGRSQLAGWTGISLTG